MFWGRPSSSREKSTLDRLDTDCPAAFRTAAKRVTTLTSEENVEFCSSLKNQAERRRLRRESSIVCDSIRSTMTNERRITPRITQISAAHRPKKALQGEPPDGNISFSEYTRIVVDLRTYGPVPPGDVRQPWLSLRCRLRADSRHTTWRHGMNPRA